MKNLNKRDELRIRAAVARLKALTDTTDPMCAVAPEHKEAVRRYVESWIVPSLTAVLNNDRLSQYDDSDATVRRREQHEKGQSNA